MAYYTEKFKPLEKKVSIPKVFVIFFHPSVLVTALGGAEKRFVETMKIFCKNGSLKITVLESAPTLLGASKIECQEYFLSPLFCGKGWLSNYVGWGFWVIKAILKSFSLVFREKPNFLFVPNNTLPNLFLGYVISYVLRLPLVVVVHHIDIPFSGEKSNSSLYDCYRTIKYSKFVSLIKTFTFYLTLSLLKRTKAIIAVSNFTAKALRVHGVSDVKIFVSGNAVDINFISRVAPINAEKIYDGIFVGRIAKEKGVFDLLNVWKRVVEEKNEAKLLIVGSGLEVSAVKEAIVKLGLEKNVFLMGPCNDRELYGLLKSSKIFIFPSLFEGWGIGVAEALACGLPVVAYDIPALREVFGECKSVFLVPVKNIENMVSTVLEILKLDEDEWYRLSGYARVYSESFSWEKVAKKDLEALKSLF
ncbi:MAG: glycosyltransferase [Candidatus Bathyarchaeota archaeon]|nr:glycosyltransferase [Candidatus Bathyarchaeota archaeon]